MLKGIGECRRQSQLPLRKHPCFWLPWWQDLLCNHVAVACASMAMQAWPHPPAGHVSESRRLCQTDSPVSCVYKQTHSQQSFVMSLWRFVFIIDFADDTKKFSKKYFFSICMFAENWTQDFGVAQRHSPSVEQIIPKESVCLTSFSK